MKILQVNVDRGREAMDLLYKTVEDKNVDIIILAEPNRIKVIKGQWYTERNLDAAIGVVNKQIKIEDTGNGPGFVWVELEKMVIYSCYISPNVNLQIYTDFLNGLRKDMKKQKKEILVGGDFNAKAFLWGSNREDKKGEMVAEWLAEENLSIHNQGNIPTFTRNEYGSIIDITFSSEKLGRSLENWKVLEEENLSLHRNITYEIKDNYRSQEKPNTCKGWRVKKENMGALVKEVGRKLRNTNITSVEQLMKHITTACHKTLPKKNCKPNRKPVYWWSDAVATKRKECNIRRRTMVRANKANNNAQKIICLEAYKYSRRALKKAILEAKTAAWKQVIEEVEEDVWGKGYRIVTNKVKSKPPTNLTGEKQMQIAAKLFPTNNVTKWNRLNVEGEETPLFSLEELTKASRRIKNKKAPGPDGVPPEVIKAVVNEYPQKILDILNRSLIAGVFPDTWKQARLVLIEKDSPNLAEKAYRPICLLNVMAKLFEQMITGRLKQEIERTGSLAPEQYGFREERSTIHALKRVQEIADEANERVGRKRCVLITLDVKNAFNTAPWEGILQELRRRKVAAYLYNLISSYLEDRILYVGSNKQMRMTCGVPQGSVIGPTMWNLYYDGVFKIPVPNGVKLIGYADDLAILVVEKTAIQLENTANRVIRDVLEWMDQKKLKLAEQKTEAVLLAAGRKIKNITVRVNNLEITSQENLKYLGIHLDRNMYMGHHIRETAKKANKAIANLARIMPNLGGPKESTRRMLLAVVNSIVLYGSVIWQRAMKKQIYRNILTGVQRKTAIRIASAYRTTSTKALLVIARIPPVDLLAEEKAMLDQGYDNKEANRIILDQWQQRWEEDAGKANWTKRLVPDIRPWVNRKHGQVNYYLTQLLTGHGCFNFYFHRFKIKEENKCIYCDIPDTTEHTFFECVRWTEERKQAELKIGRITPENVVFKMLESELTWGTVDKMVTRVLSLKRREMEAQR